MFGGYSPCADRPSWILVVIFSLSPHFSPRYPQKTSFIISHFPCLKKPSLMVDHDKSTISSGELASPHEPLRTKRRNHAPINRIFCLISGSIYRWAQRQRHTCQEVRLACDVASQKNVRYSVNLHKSQIFMEALGW